MNEPTSSITHAVGLGLAIAGLVLLVVFGAIYGTVWHVVSFSIFGASMILAYAASTVYHLIPKTWRARKIFQKIDHAMIYVLIAGTYTPICLTVLRGGWGWSLFGVVWGIAIIGVILKATINMNTTLSTIIYVLMGWIAVVAIYPLIKAMPLGGLFWLFLGGILYTIGVIFFALDLIVPRTRWWGMHEVFHLFVIAGTFSHFWMMFKYLL